MNENKFQEELNRHLHTLGLRTIPQRLLVFRMLKQVNKHLDAEGIWKLACQGDCNPNLATVYRTLNFFEKIGLVQHS